MTTLLRLHRATFVALPVLALAACGDDGASSSGDTSTTSSGGSTSTSSGGGGSTSTGGAGGSTTTDSGGSTSTGGAGGSGAGTTTSTTSTGPQDIPPLQLVAIDGTYDYPVFVTSPPGDDTRLFVVEQSGAIRLVKNGALLPTPFAELPSGGNGNEQGLIGLAFHPEYTQNGRFFVHYTVPSNDGIVAEYARSPGDPDVASPAPVKTIMTVPQGAENGHNGGMLAFGPDGFLYIGKGDGSVAQNGQKLDTRLGKILRIDVDTFPTPVPGNLPGGDPHIWDYGLRNPWRFSFDRATGDLYIGDVGETEWEEINIEPPNSGSKNYGWSVMEGNHCFLSASCDMAGKVPPALEYSHIEGCSVTGGHVYRGPSIPGMTGTYLYGDYCLGWIRGFRWIEGAVTDEVDLTNDLVTGAPLQISSFGEDAAGELYITDRSAGKVYRIEAE